MLYDVRLLAFDASIGGDPADALVRVFGLDHRAARELLRRLPHVVKRGVTEEGARKLVHALDRIGAHTEVVVSAKGPREGTGVAAQPGPAQRLGALPAPSPTASAMMDARLAREQAALRPQSNAARVSQSQPPPQRGRSAQHAYAAPAARMPSADSLPTLPDDDSLEADIGTPSHAPEAMLERATLVAMPRAVPSAQSAPAAQRAVAVQQAPAAQKAPAAHKALSAQRAPAPSAPVRGPAQAQPAARLSISQPAAAQPVAASQASFRVSLPQPVALGASAEVSLLGPEPITMPQPMVAANVQRSGATTLGAMSTVSLSAAQRPALPTLSIHGPPVEATACVMPQTKGAIVTAWLVVVVVSLSLTLLTLGVFGLVALGAFGVNWLSRRRALAAVRASALPIGQGQLPELYACVKQFALRLGMSRVPRLYLMAQGPSGVRAFNDGPELVLILDETTLRRFLDSATPQGLSALLAHELARHTLGHTRWARRTLARISPRVAYLDLVSADSVATALVGEHAIVKAALLSLLGAGSIAAYVDHDELDRVATSAAREPAFWSTRFSADDGFVLARLYHLQRGYV